MRPAGEGRGTHRSAELGWMCPALVCPWDPCKVPVAPLVRALSLLFPFPCSCPDVPAVHSCALAARGLTPSTTTPGQAGGEPRPDGVQPCSLALRPS